VWFSIRNSRMPENIPAVTLASASKEALTEGTQVVRLSAGPLRAAVVPRMGGELSSFVVTWQGQPIETLYRALDYGPTPSQWTGRAPLLWPQPGKCRLPGEKMSIVNDDEIGAWQCEGRRFEMPGHGIVRDLPWTLCGYGAECNIARATVEIGDNETTRRYFPFAFRLSCTYRLTAQSLVLEYRVVNLEARRNFWFAIGNHISFNLPFIDAGSFENCVIYSPNGLQYPIGADAFISGKPVRVGFERWTPVLGPCSLRHDVGWLPCRKRLRRAPRYGVCRHAHATTSHQGALARFGFALCLLGRTGAPLLLSRTLGGRTGQPEQPHGHSRARSERGIRVGE